ncbi:F-box/kelch-repeat protein At3g06240 [Medicago truncatula]|uniref:F-box protein interaction domain protein n=1 Tax=Medicago truncatula TaxID=3880 RepID=A0A072UY49_MEDTR|nr:F-box/kelch-repeat protein At3g06240 [Medicago truncatula]KEH34028.1 F-box protein interaction domain protein [Medicago truncatula]
MEKTTTTTTTKLIGTTLSLLCSLFMSSDPPLLSELPFELVAEILCRLPVMFLLQLRCLSKFFNTLISDPKFAKKHLRLSTTRHLILSYADIHDHSRLISYPLHSTFHQCDSIFNSVTVKPTQIRYPFNKQYNNIVGSCHGILCLTRKQSMHDKRNNVLLWNLSIRKFKILPSFKSPPNSRPTLYGFGYDHVTNVYKVLAVFSCDFGNMVFKAQGMVHTLGTNSWRMINGELPLPDNRYESLKFVSGALHWIAYRDNNHSVVSFNLGIESYGKFLPPNYGGEDVHNVILGARGIVCVSLRVVPRFLVFG